MAVGCANGVRLVEKAAYLRELAWDEVLNPVRAGRVATPGDWPWSSRRATRGEDCAPDELEMQGILSALGAMVSEVTSAYARFVAQGGQAATPDHQVMVRCRSFLTLLRDISRASFATF